MDHMPTTCDMSLTLWKGILCRDMPTEAMPRTSEWTWCLVRLKMLACFLASPDTQARFLRVSDLVEGFESSFGLELLSTVHWVVDRERVTSVMDTLRRTHAWSPRKHQFTERQIRIAITTLVHKRWIPELDAQ